MTEFKKNFHDDTIEFANTVKIVLTASTDKYYYGYYLGKQKYNNIIKENMIAVSVYKYYDIKKNQNTNYKHKVLFFDLNNCTITDFGQKFVDLSYELEKHISAIDNEVDIYNYSWGSYFSKIKIVKATIEDKSKQIKINSSDFLNKSTKFRLQVVERYDKLYLDDDFKGVFPREAIKISPNNETKIYYFEPYTRYDTIGNISIPSSETNGKFLKFSKGEYNNSNRFTKNMTIDGNKLFIMEEMLLLSTYYDWYLLTELNTKYKGCNVEIKGRNTTDIAEATGTYIQIYLLSTGWTAVKDIMFEYKNNGDNPINISISISDKLLICLPKTNQNELQDQGEGQGEDQGEGQGEGQREKKNLAIEGGEAQHEMPEKTHGWYTELIDESPVYYYYDRNGKIKRKAYTLQELYEKVKYTNFRLDGKKYRIIEDKTENSFSHIPFEIGGRATKRRRHPKNQTARRRRRVSRNPRSHNKKPNNATHRRLRKSI